MRVLAMNQFENMIRYDADLRNYGKFSVYNHPTAKDDNLAVVYIQINGPQCYALKVTRLMVNPVNVDVTDLTAAVRKLEADLGTRWNNGLLAITARSLRYTGEFTNLIKESPLKALEEVLKDPLGFDTEYQSFEVPQAMKMIEGANLTEITNWIQNNNATVRSYIHYTNEGEQFVVLGRQFREESFLMLTSYNPDKLVAYFDGMVAGRPVHQRVALEPNSFQGDKFFMDRMGRNPVEHYGSLWRLRHFGTVVTEDKELYVRGPHIAARDQLNIPSQDDFDFSENRIIVI